MSYQCAEMAGWVDQTCRYDGSVRRFRAPKRSLQDPYVACVGGHETFGRFVDTPFPQALESRLKSPCINLGSAFCGVEALTRDLGLQDIIRRSRTCILQVPDIAGQSNAYYRVHPHRNDRFLQPTPKLVALYPEVDFTEFHFVRHFLGALQAQCGDRYKYVVQELREQWASRLLSFLPKLKSPVVLLYLSYQSQPEDTERTFAPNLTIQPEMLAALTPHVAALAEVQVSPSAQSDDLEDVIFGTMQQPIAEHVIGPATHRRIAAQLASVLRDLE